MSIVSSRLVTSLRPMFERSSAMSSQQSPISSAMVRRVLMMRFAALMIVVGGIVGLSPGASASSTTAVEVRISRIPGDAALAVFAERHWVRGWPGFAKVIEGHCFGAAQAGRPTSLPSHMNRRCDSIKAAEDVALEDGAPTFGPHGFAERGSLGGLPKRVRLTIHAYDPT
jgi:hypothetical protein